MTEGLVLGVSWFWDNSEYARRSSSRWGGRVSWRTANSYDATQAFIKTLSEQATREQVLSRLKHVRLSITETSGSAFRFDENGDLFRDPVLVRQVVVSSGLAGSSYTFELVE